MNDGIETLLETLRCPSCRAGLTPSSDTLLCTNCNTNYPIVDGIPRLLLPSMRDALEGDKRVNSIEADTARSFGYEWHRFPEM